MALQIATGPASALRFALPPAGMTAGLLSFQRLYYGDWLPNTFYVKAAGRPLQELPRGLEYLVDWALAPPVLPVLALDQSLVWAIA